MFLQKKEIKELNELITQLYGWADFFQPKKDQVELKEDIYYKNKKASFFMLNNKPVPFLTIVHDINPFPMVVIDMQAVPFIAKGADLMRPGITELPEFQKDAIVSIVDMQHKKVIALGIALFSSEEIKALEKGKVIKVIHYVGDKLWQITKQ